MLSDPIITQARKMLQAFRLAVNRTFGEVEYGTGASVRHASPRCCVPMPYFHVIAHPL